MRTVHCCLLFYACVLWFGCQSQTANDTNSSIRSLEAQDPDVGTKPNRMCYNKLGTVKPYDAKFTAATAPQTNIGIIHIGKNAGNTILSLLEHRLIKSKAMFVAHYHSYAFVRELLHRLDSEDAKILTSHDSSVTVPPLQRIAFFVRSPVKRFVSGYFSRLKRGRSAWNPLERAAFCQFRSPTALAEALSSSDSWLRRAAQSAMRNILHVNSGVAFYTGGLDRLKMYRDNILFVGRVEHFAEDFGRLWDLLRAEQATTQVEVPTLEKPAQNTMRSTYAHLAHMSQLGAQNLMQWYAPEYHIMRYLADEGLLSGSYVDDLLRTDLEPW